LVEPTTAVVDEVKGEAEEKADHQRRSDSTYFSLSDGQEVEYHASFHFPPAIFNKMKDADRERMLRERKETINIATRIAIRVVKSNNSNNNSVWLTALTVANTNIAYLHLRQRQQTYPSAKFLR
jgi:hypothetical protein